MLYALLAAYVVGLVVWGYRRIRKLDGLLRKNRRMTHPNSAAQDGAPSWYRNGGDDPDWPERHDGDWPNK